MKKIRENENNFSPNRKNFSFSKKQGLEPAIPGQSQVTFGTQRASLAVSMFELRALSKSWGIRSAIPMAVMARRAGEAGAGCPGHTQFCQDRLKRAADGPANSLRSNSAGPMSCAALKPVYGSLLTWPGPPAPASPPSLPDTKDWHRQAPWTEPCRQI